MTERTIVYTDGACSGNPGPGGWGWVVPDGPRAGGGADETTNQRMELTAALEAVRSLDGPLEVRSDSTYLVNCFRDGWWKGWIERDWKNSQRKPVANRDLWEPLVEAYRSRDIRFTWVKGHSGDRWNDEADRLAVEAIPDRIDTSRGRVIAVTGHRPPELGGYDAEEAHDAVRSDLRDILVAKSELHPTLTVVTGLGLGSEMLGAEAAVAANLPLLVVLAHPDQDSRWPESTRRRFARLRDAATEVVTLDRRAPKSKQGAASSYSRRDAWIRDVADEAIVVWDRQDVLLGRTVRDLSDALGEENVWLLEPRVSSAGGR